MQKITISKNDSGIRCDKFLKKAFPNLPNSLMYKAFRKKDIKLDGKHIPESFILPEGGDLSIYLPDDVLSSPPKKFSPTPGDISVIYEDENIAILDKDKGVPSQSGRGLSAPLCDLFKTYLYNRKEYDPENERGFSPALCNRLDENTQGLVIGAKNAAALRAMNEEIRFRRVKKYYLCETQGFPPKDADLVTLCLKKLPDKNKSVVSPDGVKTETRYRVLKKTPRGAILEIELLTGKSHQIRAVMAHLGCPIFGDKKYGASPAPDFQRLIAYKLEFDVQNPLLTYLNGKIFYSNFTI